MDTILEMTSDAYAALWKHLLRPNAKAEEAAFCFVSPSKSGCLELSDWHPVPDKEFEYHSLYHIELTDECRAKVLKRAHDLRASIVEFHSHPYSYPAQFSFSDLAGFEEFVPHVWWRLKGGPYAAVVAAPSGFDSLVWSTNPHTAYGLLQIKAGSQLMNPTGLSYQAITAGCKNEF